MPKFYTRFNLPPKVGVKYDPAEGRTQQQFRDECDIAKTVERYGDPNKFWEAMRVQNAIANQTRKPVYGDFSELPDLQEAMNAVHEADRMFMELPAKVRDRFANDPRKLLEFIQDPKNLDEAIRLGIAQKRTETAQGQAEAPSSATPVAEESQKAPTGDSGDSVTRT